MTQTSLHRYNIFFSNGHVSSRICRNVFRTTTFLHNLLLHNKHFFRAVSSFRVTSSTQQLLFPSSYFFKAVTFLEQQLFLICHFFSAIFFFQNSNFFRAKLLPSSYLLRIDSLLEQLLFRRTNSFRIKIKELLFRSKYFYTVYNFSEKQYSVTYFLRTGTLTKLHLLSTATILIDKLILFTSVSKVQ